MKRYVSVIGTAVLVGLLIVGCTQAAPAPAPTAAPAPPKAAEPTKPAPGAAAPTAAPAAPAAVPAKKVDYPQKGKTLTYIAPYAPGGSSDTIMRLMQPVLERELGIPVQIVNKVGAGSQIGTTEIALSKPDGYTFGYTSLPTVNSIYLDPDRKAAFGRKDLQPLTEQSVDYNVWAVKTESPYKTVKDLVDAAKANPKKISISSSGVGSITHMGLLKFAQVAGVDINIVQFDGQGPATTALLGGHIDVSSTYVGNIAGALKSKQMRLIGIMGPERNKYAPDVPSFLEQGYKDVEAPNIRGFVMPAGAPKEVVDTLVSALKKSQEAPDYIKALEEQYYTLRYADPADFSKLWNDWDTKVVPLMELVRKASQ